MVLLDEALQQSAGKPVPETVQQTYLASAARDVAELLPQLEPRAEEVAQKALQKLQERGKREADELLKILEKQKSRVQQELEQHEQGGEQLVLKHEKESEEYRQLEANVRSWKRQLERFDKDLQEEPARIQGNYEVQAQRVEPVGLVYLWPGES
jgi:chromosome segregation ATPase